MRNAGPDTPMHAIIWCPTLKTGEAMPSRPPSNSLRVVAKLCSRTESSSHSRVSSRVMVFKPAFGKWQCAEGVHRLAQGRAMRRHFDVYPVHGTDHVGRVDLCHMCDRPSADNREIDGFAGVIADSLEYWFGR